MVQVGRNRSTRPQYIDVTYMGGTASCGPMSIIFDSVIKSLYISIKIKFGAHRTIYVSKTAVYRLDYYIRYRTLWTDEYNFR